MPYDISSSSDNCYPNTTCLINKFGIQDESALNEVEANITFAKASLLSESPINGSFDFNHYKAIHKFLFEDLFDWAGEIRTVNLSKKSTQFTAPEHIEERASKCFAQISKENYFKDYKSDEFIDRIVDLYCDTNMIHPFREGNGRTQRCFFEQLIRFVGYDINFSNIDADELMIATIQSANGVTDNLKRIFTQNIKELD